LEGYRQLHWQQISPSIEIQLGADLPTIAKLTGMSTPEAKDIHRRPALIQELTWRPQPLGFSSKTEPVQEVIFSFYGGELFRIVVNYDRYETEGLTTEDLVEVLSATYAVEPAAPLKAALDTYSNQEVVFARWQDPQYRFDLLRSSYGANFKLVGVLKKLEAPAQAAIIEAGRLDDKEAPQRDAARIASEEEAGRAKLEKGEACEQT